LFFFDGEKIEALADPDRASTVIETAVHSLLGVATLEQLRTDLVALQRRQTPPSEDVALEQQIADLHALRESAQADLDALAQRRGQVRVEVGQVRTELDRAERAFARDGGELFERRVSLETERAHVAHRLHETREELRGAAEHALPLSLVMDNIEHAARHAQDEQAASDAKKTATVLAERDLWLLAMLSGDTRAKLESALAEDRSQREAHAAISVYLDLSDDALTKLVSARAAVEAEAAGLQRLLATARELDDKLAYLETQLAGVPDEDLIGKRIADRDSLRTRVAGLEGQLVVFDEEYARVQQHRRDAEESLAKLEAERLRTAVLRDDVARMIKHSERVRDTLALLRERLVERHIGKLEIATLDSLQKLMRKQHLVQDLRINPQNFSLQLLGADGTQLPASRLSAGERQLLAVALLWGLARVAGNRLPTVIDTPLGRLDSRHRRHLVERYFPNASSQVLLLSTDEEIDEEMLSILEPSIAHTYLLDHDDRAHVTVVRPGYWWPLENSHVA
jgi:DNA sulfur modification protein DndD